LKSLLLHLTLGLYPQDVPEDKKELVAQFVEKGYVKQNEKGIYHLNSKYRAGVVSDVSESGTYLKALGVEVKDLFIESDAMLDAKKGDIVIAQRLLGRRGKAQAKIVEILGRAESYSVAFVKKVEGESNRINLYDIRNEYPAGVEVSDEQLATFKVGDAFQINNQTATIVKKLGNIYDEDDAKVDENIVLALYNKHDEFEEDVLAAAQSFDKEVDASKHPHRRDLRHLDFCTIDPVSAKDFDDAICYDKKHNIIYVAIADVSYYVKPFGAIDTEAIYRSFSIYLPHRSIPMLPRELSETLCSLQPHVDRLAYVFEIHLRDDLSVKKSEVYEALIYSKRRFNYEEIDDFFEGKKQAENEEEARIVATLHDLRKVTDALKEKRLKVGYDFRSEDLEMFLDEKVHIIKTAFAPETPSHSLIEDCMLLANKAAASMYEHGVFRIHEEPSQSKLENLYQELASIGIMIELNGDMKEIISNIQAQARALDLESEVDTLIIRAQMRARYAPENKGHFGLGFERYTHFTSPIRRYADLIVHRLIKAIQAGDSEESSYVLRNIDALCISISEKEREASDVEFKFMDRKFARWAYKNLHATFNARVVATEPEYEGEIHDDISGAKVKLKNCEGIVLFDDVRVKIESVNLATSMIVATVVEKKLTDDEKESK